MNPTWRRFLIGSGVVILLLSLAGLEITSERARVEEPSTTASNLRSVTPNVQPFSKRGRRTNERSRDTRVNLRHERLGNSSTSRLLGARLVRAPGRLIFSDDHWRLLAQSLELSKRESQIVQAVFDDNKESAIAVGLGISSHTVHTHIERLYRKLGITSRVALVSRVFTQYLWLQEGRERVSGFPREDHQGTVTRG